VDDLSAEAFDCGLAGLLGIVSPHPGLGLGDPGREAGLLPAQRGQSVAQRRDLQGLIDVGVEEPAFLPGDGRELAAEAAGGRARCGLACIGVTALSSWTEPGISASITSRGVAG
jgi:hypothetical protein